MDKVYSQLDGNINFIELANTGPLQTLKNFQIFFHNQLKARIVI